MAHIDKLDLAFLPTPIQKLNRLSEELGVEIWIKRDDLTGIETSGNKIRKLEFTVKKALEKQAKVLITCGGIQSNHCRSTAAVAAKLGLLSHLVLRIDEEPNVEGNYFLDKVLGAQVTFISRSDYSNRRNEIMKEIQEDYLKKGIEAYVIPEGASDGIGNLGYVEAVKEILNQEKELGITFDSLVCAVGSGGTFAGLFLGTKLYAPDKQVLGFNVCDDAQYFRDVCEQICGDTAKILEADIQIKPQEMQFIDGYKGKGYAISSEEELQFITDLARKEGVILDPVYTGKAMYGFYQEVKKGNLTGVQNVLFIHTGGLYGLFPKQEQLAPLL